MDFGAGKTKHVYEVTKVTLTDRAPPLPVL